jgi:hypothetical protein
VGELRFFKRRLKSWQEQKDNVIRKKNKVRLRLFWSFLGKWVVASYDHSVYVNRIGLQDHSDGMVAILIMECAYGSQ